MTEILLESVVSLLVVQVPFAGHRCSVSRITKHLGYSDRAIQCLLSSLVGVETSQQTDSRRVAFSGIIKLGESKTLICQKIYVWRLNLTRIATEIGVTEIIHHH